MAIIRYWTTLQDIEDAGAETIWYSVATCWWTHRPENVYQHPADGLPCDPRGGMLMMSPSRVFLDNAEANPDHYGRNGLDALMAAHHDNCVVSADDSRNTCLRSWDEYNDLLEEKGAAVDHA